MGVKCRKRTAYAGTLAISLAALHRLLLRRRREAPNFLLVDAAPRYFAIYLCVILTRAWRRTGRPGDVGVDARFLALLLYNRGERYLQGVG